MTQHVRETTSEVSEQDVGETTRKRNAKKRRDDIGRLSVKPWCYWLWRLLNAIGAFGSVFSHSWTVVYC